MQYILEYKEISAERHLVARRKRPAKMANDSGRNRCPVVRLALARAQGSLRAIINLRPAAPLQLPSTATRGRVDSPMRRALG